jgi:hypothetical protein
VATLFRSHDGAPVFNVEKETVYDAAGQAQFYIVNNNTVHRCADGVVCFWVSGSYLFREGGHPAFYFDEVERREELAGLAAENEIDQTIADELFPELASDKIA